MGKKIFILFFLMLNFLHAYVQNSFTVRGVVKDSSGNFLSKATINLSIAGDSIRALSGDDGVFSVAGLHMRAFEIQVTMNGYSPYHKRFIAPDSARMFQLPLIILQTEFRELQPVFVEQVRPFIIKTDTLEYHAGAYAMRDGSMLADLLKKLPGMTLNSDSGVLIMGKKIRKVLLDGKEFFGGEVQTAIRNLPYDIIDKVEIIDDYGDQARLTGVKTGEPEKVLNIELKKDKRNGEIGNIQGGGGNQNQYTAGAVTNAFAGERRLSLMGALTNNNPAGQEYTHTLNLDNVDRWGPAWSGLGNGSLSGSNYVFQNSTIQDTRYAGGQTHQEQDNINRGNKQQQQLSYEGLYSPNSNSYLRINTSFSQQQSDETDQINLSSTESDSGFSKSTQSATINQFNVRDIKAESKIYFAQTFPHSGQRLKLDADIKYAFNQQTGDNLINTQIQSDSQASQSLQHYQVSNGNKGWDISAALHYYIPLGTGGYLETGYDLHHTLNESDRNWRQPDSSGGDWKTVDSLSNNYTFRTIIQDWQTAYNRHGEKTDLNLGLKVEQGNLDGKSPGEGNGQSYHYSDLFPIGSFNYLFNQARKISLGYITSVSLPSIQQVQPVTDLSNPQYPVTGNPDLKPALNQSLSLTYEQNQLQPTQYQGFGIGIGYTRTKDLIIADIIHPHDTGSTIQQTYFENVNGAYTINLNGRFDLPALLHKRLKISDWGTFSESHGIAMADHVPYTTKTLAVSENLNLRYDIPDKIETNLYFIYTRSLTSYTSADNPSQPASTLTWGMNNRYYFFRNWTLSYEFMQYFSSGITPGLSPGPLILNMHIQRSILKKQQVSCDLSADNIFNSNAGVGQSVTPTTITQSRSNLVGRIIMFSLQWKFERFRKKNL